MIRFYLPQDKPNSRQHIASWVVSFGFLVAIAGLMPQITSAHAIIVNARPAVNSEVPPGELELRLDFNSRIDLQRSRLSLQRPDGTDVAVALAPHSPPNVLAGHASVTMAGRWKLRWQVLSLDGHITRGEVNFSVRDNDRVPSR